MVEQKPPLECFVSRDDVAMVICVFTQTRGGGRMIVKKRIDRRKKYGLERIYKDNKNDEPETNDRKPERAKPRAVETRR